MLTKLRIRNFKCFEDTGEMEIRPLTLFVGPNSSGKSSILQMLLALRQTVESIDIRTAFAPNDGWVRLGSYPDFIFRHDWQRPLELMLEFTEWQALTPTRRRRELNLMRKPRTLVLKVCWRYNKKTTQIQLERSETELWTEEGKLKQLVLRNKRGDYEVIVTVDVNGQLEEWRHEGMPFRFYDFAARLKRGEKPEDFEKRVPRHRWLFVIGRIIEAELHRLIYIGPLREFPQRSYVISGQAPSNVGVRGERVAEVLWFATRTKERRRRMLERVNRWVREFGIAREVQLQRLGRSNQYQVLFVDPATGLPVNIADVGFGSSQLLPIIVQGFYAPSGSILLVEQPEIHLHPRAQATLGDLLMEIVKQGDRQIIVETHSEHLLARIQRRIAERQFSPQQVAIYYFEPTREGTRIHRIELDEYGRFSQPLPAGFFEESLDEAFAHMRAISKRKAEEAKVVSERVDD